jgi:hypothetical protein
MILQACTYVIALAGVVGVAHFAQEEMQQYMTAEKNIVTAFTPGPMGRLPAESSTVLSYENPANILEAAP